MGQLIVRNIEDDIVLALKQCGRRKTEFAGQMDELGVNNRDHGKRSQRADPLGLCVQHILFARRCRSGGFVPI
jgi:hypothetical protein